MRNVNCQDFSIAGKQKGAFYINYEECKFTHYTSFNFILISFILTMRNVNNGS